MDASTQVINDTIEDHINDGRVAEVARSVGLECAPVVACHTAYLHHYFDPQFFTRYIVRWDTGVEVDVDEELKRLLFIDALQEIVGDGGFVHEAPM